MKMNGAQYFDENPLEAANDLTMLPHINLPAGRQP